MKVTKMYVAPVLEELEIAVEQGFATTGGADVNYADWGTPGFTDPDNELGEF